MITIVQQGCTVHNPGMHRTSFGDWLKAQRAVRRVSQYGLADATGIDRTHIAKMESGSIALPGDATRVRLHEFFGTTDDDLVEAGILERIQVGDRPAVYLPATLASRSSAGREGKAEDCSDIPSQVLQLLREIRWSEGAVNIATQQLGWIRDAQRGALEPPTPSWELEDTTAVGITEFGEGGEIVRRKQPGEPES